MYKIFSIMFFLTFLNPLHAKAFKEIVHIDKTTKIMTQSTTCAKSKWENKTINACQCCLTKHNLQGGEASKSIAHCKKKKHCTEEVLKQISDTLGVSYGSDIQKFTDAIQKASLVATRIQPPATLKGLVDEKTFMDLLKTLKVNGLYEGKTELDQCTKVIQAKGGFFSTVILILLEDQACMRAPNGNAEETEWEAKIVLKGLTSPDTELKNLKVLKGTDLAQKSGAGIPKISLYESVFSYKVDGKRQYYILLEAASGKAFMDIVQKSAAALEKFDKENYKNMEETQMSAAYRSLGTQLANFHLENMEKLTPNDKGKVLRKTVIHGDLHYENVFIKGEVVSLIDPESMSKSATGKKADHGHDIAKMILFPVAIPKKSLNIKGMGEKGISKRIFLYATAKPFLEAYVAAFVKSGASKEKIKDELMSILVKQNAVQMLINYRKGKPHLYNPFVLPAAQKYLKDIITAL